MLGSLRERRKSPISERKQPNGKNAPILVCIFFISLLIGAKAPPVAAETLLRIHGSNTIGRTLLPALVKVFLKQEGYDNINEKKGDNEDESFIIGERNSQNDQIEIHAHGSKTAFIDIGNSLCDIGSSSRPINNDEQKSLLPKLGDLRSNDSEHVIALDGIALIVPKSNPVKTLSVTQIADIFSGTITEWSRLGAPLGTIALYARDDKSGTYEFFRDAVLNTHGKTLSTNAQRFEDSEKLTDVVSRDPLGIGFVGLNYIGSNNVIAISDTGVKARLPSIRSIKTEDYLLSRRLYLYTAVNPLNPNIRKFIEFVSGCVAQGVIATTDFVNQDLTPVPSNPDDARNQSATWQSLTKDAKQIPATIRFLPGSDALDTKANKDIVRIAEVLSQPEYHNKKVILIGFADSSGSQSTSLKISNDRAKIVKWKLVEFQRNHVALQGLDLSQVEGLGAEAFVATNETQEGREKNRRVEIWVK